MLRLLCLALLLCASSAHAVESGEAWVSLADGQLSVNSTGVESSSAKVMLDASPSLKSYTYTDLVAISPSPPAGSIAWCSDCNEWNPCFPGAGAPGAFARKTGAGTLDWECAAGQEIDQAFYCDAATGGSNCTGGGTWSKASIKFLPKYVRIRCLGGGGSGGSGGLATVGAGGGPGGGGGAGGTYCESVLAWASVPSTLQVTPAGPSTGANGVSGTVGTAGNNGSPGNPSSVTESATGRVLCLARGGNNGAGAASPGNASGGGGVADTLPRPWGNYSGGAGRGSTATATSFTCATAGPWTALPCTATPAPTAVVPYGTATYAGGSGGGGGRGEGSSLQGGNGGLTLSVPTAAVCTNSAGAAGADGTSFLTTNVGAVAGTAGGGGAGGAGRTTTGAAGKGGNGGFPGGGGGGGGGNVAASGATSGAGGNGSGGYCEILTVG